MAYSYNIEEVPMADEPCVEHDIRRAKQFLLKHSPESGDNLYDHLSDLLSKILAERPKNAVDLFEEYSRKLKEERFKTQTNHLRDVYVPPMQYENAKKLIALFQSAEPETTQEEDRMEEDEEGEKKKSIPNMMDLLFYFEQTGVGLPRGEMILLNLAIRKLASTVPIENVRFWGKILGNPKNYYVVEAELNEDELRRRLEQVTAAEEIREENREERVQDAGREEEEISGEDKEEKGLQLVFPPLPISTWKMPAEVPPELIGTGVNAKVYFVCNRLGIDDWLELPPVTPQQIVISREIVRYFTGNLKTPIHTFPPFPGTEENYLRAEIARISAATDISPIGYFTFGGLDEEEEIDEEMEEGGTLTENVHYDPLPVKDLVDPSMSNWCHHTPYILKQGRTVWWDPREREEEALGEEEEEEGEEDETRVGGAVRETGPPLLTPLSEDAILESVFPWTTRQSSFVQLDTAVALVRSNIWPGAYAFAVDKRFANVYIGWGHKYTAYNYNPPSMPPVQDQYKIGPEVMEIRDPTFEEEEAYRIAHLPPPPLSIGEGEEELGEEEEEEEDEEEDE
ncbi:radial spoke head protein 6 A [Vespula squamosa]|uniref:Radial spoke head protein 6 A n=1 Tax=Vespula squamosa TaxID=30214 RepID=A0ABD1ZST5_VESSQ